MPAFLNRRTPHCNGQITPPVDPLTAGLTSTAGPRDGVEPGPEALAYQQEALARVLADLDRRWRVPPTLLASSIAREVVVALVQDERCLKALAEALAPAILAAVRAEKARQANRDVSDSV